MQIKNDTLRQIALGIANLELGNVTKFDWEEFNRMAQQLDEGLQEKVPTGTVRCRTKTGDAMLEFFGIVPVIWRPWSDHPDNYIDWSRADDMVALLVEVYYVQSEHRKFSLDYLGKPESRNMENDGLTTYEHSAVAGWAFYPFPVSCNYKVPLKTGGRDL